MIIRRVDPANTFDTKGTNAAVRAEYTLLTAASLYLLWKKRSEVRWPVAAGLFWYTDVIGYMPGAVAYRRSKTKRIPKHYYAAYNILHSGVSASVVAALWARLVRPEWAMLGMPLHIGVDRGLLGNFLKPFSVSFEPEVHPAWEKVREELSKPWPGNGASADHPAEIA